MTTFALPWLNPDLDIHPGPPEGWDRVAVICGWSDARKARERWPDAAVVGPLRTLRGLDLFVRGLLANPQIRVVIWDGPDLTPGETTKSAVIELWDSGGFSYAASLAKAVARHLPTITAELRRLGQEERTILLTLFSFYQGARLLPVEEWRLAESLGEQWRYMEGGDRPGGALILPPPEPTSSERAPHGDPGDRIVADTLADLWPRALARVLRCGREAETQHGGTHELLNLVSVIRDPGKTLSDFPSWVESGVPEVSAVAAAQPHPVLGFSFADVEAYAERLTGAKVPEGAAYSYGSRMRGHFPGLLRPHPMPSVEEMLHPAPDQIAAQEALLAHDSRTRAAYLTPWRPDADAGRESGRPCLTGVWFRVVDGALHMTVTFRSHDTYAGYPLNLAACCLWLVRLADKLGMSVGTLTCLSMSAHVYDRDLADAQKVVVAYKPPAGPRWDQRAAWRVELVRTETTLQPVGPFETMRAWNDQNRISFEQAMERVEATLLGLGDFVRGQPQLRAGRRLYIRETKSDGSLENRDLTPDELTRLTILIAEEAPKLPPMPGPPAFSLRATALTPDGTGVLQVFEAKTPEKLLRDISESGLIQEVGSALWLGREVERVWAGRSA